MFIISSRKLAKLKQDAYDYGLRKGFELAQELSKIKIVVYVDPKDLNTDSIIAEAENILKEGNNGG